LQEVRYDKDAGRLPSNPLRLSLDLEEPHTQALTDRVVCSGVVMKRRVMGIFLLTLVLVGLWAVRFAGKRQGVRLAGYVEADVYLLGFEFPGRLLSVRVEEGHAVKAGETLAVLDTTDFHLERKRLEAQLAAAYKNLEALAIRRANLTRTFKRYTSLETGNVAPVQLENLQTEIQTLKLREQEAQHQIQALQTSLQGVEDRLHRAVLTAPRKGVILDRLAREGETVLPGRPVLRLGVLDTVEVIAFLPETDLPRFHVGDTLWIQADGLSHPLPGRLSWIAPEAEYASSFVQTPESRKDLVYRARIRVANPEGLLKIGMPVDIFPSRP